MGTIVAAMVHLTRARPRFSLKDKVRPSRRYLISLSLCCATLIMMSSRGRGVQDVTRTKWVNPLLSGTRVQVELPRLIIQVEREAGRAISRTYTHDGDICRIGSAASNDLVVDDPTISRFHCRIQRERGAWRIVDTGSTNGTRVDGVRILAAELEGHAALAIGESLLRVSSDRGESASLPVVQGFGSLVGAS